MTEPKLVSLPHDPECIWCRMGIAPDLAQLDYGRLRLIPSATPTAYSQPDTATPADPSATSSICCETLGPAKASGESHIPGLTCRHFSSTEVAGPSQREQLASPMPSTPTALDSTSPGGFCTSKTLGARKVGRHAGTQEAGDDPAAQQQRE